MKRTAPSAQRNAPAIFEYLKRWLSNPGELLEIGSGTGQHAAWFASRLPHLSWQPSERDVSAFESIRAWRDEAGLDNVAEPLVVDVAGEAWPTSAYDYVFTANTLHIMHVREVEACIRGAARVLTPGGMLVVYGPFRAATRPFEDSNAAFDAHLRSRDPGMGIRDFEWVSALCRSAGLCFADDVAMPANNRLLRFIADTAEVTQR